MPDMWPPHVLFAVTVGHSLDDFILPPKNQAPMSVALMVISKSSITQSLVDSAIALASIIRSHNTPRIRVAPRDILSHSNDMSIIIIDERTKIPKGPMIAAAAIAARMPNEESMRTAVFLFIF